MMTCSTLTDQLALIYQQQLDFVSRPFGGRASHLWRELETMLGLGILICDNIRHRHLSWYANVEANHIAYDIEDAQAFAHEYQWWMAATQHWITQIEQLQQEGFDVAHACEIQKLYDDLKLVNLDVRELVSRYEELERGGGIEASEFFASLRNHESE